MLTRWKTKGHIKDFNYKALYYNDGLLPRSTCGYFVGLVGCRRFKPGYPLKIIVSSMGNPLYLPLATFLHNKLFKTIPKVDSYIKNSFELVEKLRMLHTTGAHELVLLDVTSFFTHVPMNIAVDCVNEQ